VRRVAWISAVIVVVLGTSASGAAASPISEESMSKGWSADAELSRCYVDQPEPGEVLCDFRSITVSEGWSRDASEPPGVDQVCLSRSTFIQGVTGDITSAVYASGCSTDAEFSVDKDLGAASANGTITTQRTHCDPADNQCEPIGSLEVAVDIDWTATGPAISTKVHTSDEYPNGTGTCVRTVYSNRQDRPAAASGDWGGDAVTFDSAAIHEAVFKISVRCHG
jgi:hypothetical protein